MNLAMDSFVLFILLFPTLSSSKNCHAEPSEDDPNCRVRFEGGNNVERYYKWLPETEPPLNLAIPDELNYFCQRQNEATFCRFPQDLTSQGYYSTLQFHRNLQSILDLSFLFREQICLLCRKCCLFPHVQSVS